MTNINKILLVVLFSGLSFNGYWTKRLVTFAKKSSEYYQWLDIQNECMVQKEGADRSDAFLAARGLRREDLKGQNALYYPIRKSYDMQFDACKKFVKEKCWVIDFEDPKNVEHCWDNFMTAEEYKQYKKTGKNPLEK